MEKKLGLSALTALVLSSMLGAGVFSLPQNMAAVASPAALLIGWGITGAGILLLAFAMLILTRIRPELDGGIFTYAREGFGELIGFCSAWGYWLCAVIANVSYLVIVFSALSFFTDTPELRLFGDGNTWQSIVGASALLWIVHFLILRGVQTAASINLVATLAKLLPLGLFVVLAIMMFKLDTFKLDFTGLALGVPVWEQVKNTMLITLWVFIGVEGAVVVSARARNKRDVGKATLLAVLSALGVYLLVTLLSLGVVARPELAETSEMILVPYFLVGAFLLKIATRPLHKAVGVGACIYGLWLLYASGPMHLLLSVVLYAPGLLVFLYARKTHTHDNVLNRQEMVLIGMLLIASVPATWMLVG
ncbi:TPA: amino acid permease [Escherichia coli]|nr:amino acid permease [Escherichia coli]HDP7259910.1 amino acid permease [Escherichia coli]